MDGKSGLQTKNAPPKPAFSLSQPGLLQRTCECGGVPGLTGKCEECSSKQLSGQRGTNAPAAPNSSPNDPSITPIQPAKLGGYSFEKLAIAPKERLGIQAKLAIGQPGDRYEQEADRVAAQVVQRIHTPVSNSSTQMESVQRKKNEDEDELQLKPIAPIQRKDMSAGGEVSTDLESEINRARGGGQPLAPELQAKMGEAMGADFSGVRVHTDERSDALNQSVGARAFTTGQDLFFKRGEYQPGSRRGHELIAHELMHVVQQHEATVHRFPWNRETGYSHEHTAIRSRGNVAVVRLAGKKSNHVSPPIQAKWADRVASEVVDRIHSSAVATGGERAQVQRMGEEGSGVSADIQKTIQISNNVLRQKTTATEMPLQNLVIQRRRGAAILKSNDISEYFSSDFISLHVANSIEEAEKIAEHRVKEGISYAHVIDRKSLPNLKTEIKNRRESGFYADDTNKVANPLTGNAQFLSERKVTIYETRIDTKGRLKGTKTKQARFYYDAPLFGGKYVIHHFDGIELE